MKDVMKFPLNLQFFADGEGDGADGAGENTGAEGAGEQGNHEPDTNKGGETGKTFTQEQLSAVAANEKAQGKNSILKLFGVKDEKAAKEQAKAFKEWQEAQKTTEQKLHDSEKSIAEANAKATAAENKLACMMAGVNKDSVDDALAIATLKITEEKNLEAVLDEMKKEPRYKGFFAADSSDDSSSNKGKGTGNPAGHQGTGSGGNVGNIGERLGKARQAAAKKSNFFTN